jgi:hypothetical protein
MLTTCYCRAKHAWREQGFDIARLARHDESNQTTQGLLPKRQNHNVLLLCFVDKLPQQVFTSTLGRSVKISSVMTN